MKAIIIKDTNKEKIESAIKEAEGRAKERLICFADIESAIKEIEKKFHCVTKKSMEGLSIIVDPYAQKYPKAYKYTPESTQFLLTFEKGSWRLRWVARRAQDKYCVKSYEVVAMPEDLINAIVKDYMKF